MPLHWTYPDNFQINLYRSGWKSDRGFNRIVADIGSGQFKPVSEEKTEFVIKSNTINKVRTRYQSLDRNKCKRRGFCRPGYSITGDSPKPR